MVSEPHNGYLNEMCCLKFYVYSNCPVDHAQGIAFNISLFFYNIYGPCMDMVDPYRLLMMYLYIYLIFSFVLSHKIFTPTLGVF